MSDIVFFKFVVFETKKSLNSNLSIGIVKLRSGGKLKL